MAGFGSCVAALAALICLQLTESGATLLPPNTVHLGSIEGKSYYITRRNWYQANDFCNNAGLKLATVTTVEQHNFLVSKHPLLGIQNHYWTAGREYAGATNFRWPGGSNVHAFQMFEPANSLLFVAASATVGAIVSSANGVQFPVMCESR